MSAQSAFHQTIDCATPDAQNDELLKNATPQVFAQKPGAWREENLRVHDRLDDVDHRT
jgi:hypothetical protein